MALRRPLALALAGLAALALAALAAAAPARADDYRFAGRWNTSPVRPVDVAVNRGVAYVAGTDVTLRFVPEGWFVPGSDWADEDVFAPSIAIDPDNHQVFVPHTHVLDEPDHWYDFIPHVDFKGDNPWRNAIARFDSLGKEKLADWELDSAHQLTALAVDPGSHMVYVLAERRDGSAAQVTVTTPDGRFNQFQWSPGRTSPRTIDHRFLAVDIAVDPLTQDVLTLSQAKSAGLTAGVVKRWEPNGELIDQFTVPASAGAKLRGLAVGPFGNVFVTASTGDPDLAGATVVSVLTKYAPPGEQLFQREFGATIASTGNRRLVLWGLDVDDDGNLYVADWGYPSSDHTDPRYVYRFEPVVTEVVNTGLVARPPRFTRAKALSFKLATIGGVRFGCQLRRVGESTAREKRAAHWHACDATKTFRNLRSGTYVFTGRSFDSAGKSDPTPLSVRFTIDRRAPRTRIAGGPRGATHRRTARFRLRSSEKRSLFECRLQRSGQRRKAERRLARWHPCHGRLKVDHLRRGGYRVRARAIDRAGNRDRSPATRKFRVRR